MRRGSVGSLVGDGRGRLLSVGPSFPFSVLLVSLSFFEPFRTLALPCTLIPRTLLLALSLPVSHGFSLDASLDNPLPLASVRVFSPSRSLLLLYSANRCG